MAKVSPATEHLFRHDVNPKKLNVAELHVDMNRLRPMYFLHHVETWLMRATALVAVILAIILVAIWIASAAGTLGSDKRELIQANSLFWGTFFIMILSLCGNFMSDRKDKSIMPYVNDYIEKIYPDENDRPTPLNVLRSGRALNVLWNGLSSTDERYFIDENMYGVRKLSMQYPHRTSILGRRHAVVRPTPAAPPVDEEQ